jgi:hypothetical protein
LKHEGIVNDNDNLQSLIAENKDQSKISGKFVVSNPLKHLEK